MEDFFEETSQLWNHSTLLFSCGGEGRGSDGLYAAFKAVVPSTLVSAKTLLDVKMRSVPGKYHTRKHGQQMGEAVEHRNAALIAEGPCFSGCKGITNGCCLKIQQRPA